MKKYHILFLIFSITLFSTLIFSETAFAITDPPTNLTATAKPGQNIRLEWDAPRTIGGYQIERESPVGGGWSILISDTGNTKQFYVDTGLSMNTVYNYRVSAILNSEISLPSNTANVNTSDAGVLKKPTPPRELTAIGGNNQVTLRWVEPNPRGSPITDYVIEFSHNNGEVWQFYDDGQNTETAITIQGLFPDHYYVFRVYAVNDIGTSNFSEIIERTYNEEKKRHSIPVVEGIGFYKIKTVNVDNPYSKALLGTDVDTTGAFHGYIPYSQHTDITDLENYGKFAEYEKRGSYFKIDKKTAIPTFYGNVNEPIQLQIKLNDEFASTKIEHVSLFMSSYGKTNDFKFTDIEIMYQKGKTVDVKDPGNLIKDVKMSSSLEDGDLWINFDIIFEKSVKKSDISIQAWNELRIPTNSKIFKAIEIIDNKTTQQEKEHNLTADIEITHDSSSPTCKINDSCFIPYNAKIVSGGIVTWTNVDSSIHMITSGTFESGPDNRFNTSLMPGKIFQKTFDNPGNYQYYCSMHPWASGIISVFEEKVIEKQIDFDESRPAIIVASVGSGGSLIIENDERVVLETQDLHVNISGHVQEETKARNISIVIIRPDKTVEEIQTSTNDRGYYSIPSILSKQWQEGFYEIIAKFKGNEIGNVGFIVTDKEGDFGARWSVQYTHPMDLIKSLIEGDITEKQFDMNLESFDFPTDGVDYIKNRLKILQNQG